MPDPTNMNNLTPEQEATMKAFGKRFREFLDQAGTKSDCPDLKKMDSGEWLDISFAMTTILFDPGLNPASGTGQLLRQANQVAAEANTTATRFGALLSFPAMAAFATSARKG